jgi:phosphate transport system permease protein
VSVNANDSTLMLAGSTGSQLQVLSLTSEENMMTGEVTNEQKRIELPQMTEPVKNIFIDPRQQWLYVVNGVPRPTYSACATRASTAATNC